MLDGRDKQYFSAFVPLNLGEIDLPVKPQSIYDIDIEVYTNHRNKNQRSDPKPKKFGSNRSKNRKKLQFISVDYINTPFVIFT